MQIRDVLVSVAVVVAKLPIMYSRLLKLCSPYISNSICDIINQVLETGIFPDDWKKAKVNPIFKSDERNIPSNYRPISIL